MQGQSQNTQTKVCVSCKRQLTYDFYGESYASKDGYNSNCRDCRNQKRRLDYGKTVESFIYRLNKVNSEAIPDFTQSQFHFDLWAFSTIDWSILKVNFRRDQDSIYYEIQNLDSNLVVQVRFLTKEDMNSPYFWVKEYIVKDLYKRSLRICLNIDDMNLLRPG